MLHVECILLFILRDDHKFTILGRDCCIFFLCIDWLSMTGLKRLVFPSSIYGRQAVTRLITNVSMHSRNFKWNFIIIVHQKNGKKKMNEQ